MASDYFTYYTDNTPPHVNDKNAKEPVSKLKVVSENYLHSFLGII